MEYLSKLSILMILWIVALDSNYVIFCIKKKKEKDLKMLKLLFHSPKKKKKIKK